MIYIYTYKKLFFVKHLHFLILKFNLKALSLMTDDYQTDR